MRRFPINNINEYILFRLRFQKLPEWYAEWLSQESRLMKAAQVLGKMQEIDEIIKDEINSIWETLEAAGAVETPTILLDRIAALETSRDEINQSIADINGEIEAIETSLNEELNQIDDRIIGLDARIQSIEDNPFDPSPIFQQITALEDDVNQRFATANASITDIIEDTDDLREELDQLKNDQFDPSDIIERLDTSETLIFSLDDALLSLETDVFAMMHDLDTLEDTVSSSVDSINASLSDIENAIGGYDFSEMDDRITAAELAIQEIQQDEGIDLSPILNDISQLQQDIIDLQDSQFDPTELESQISAVEASLSNLSSDFDGLNIEQLRQRVTDAEAAIDALEAVEPFDPSALQQEISNITAEITSITAALTDLQPLPDQVSGILSEIESIKDRVEALEEGGGGSDFDPTDILNRLNAAEQAISTLESLIGDGEGVDLSGILDRLDALEAQINAIEPFDPSGLQDQIDAINADIDNITGLIPDITPIDTRLSDAEGDISILQADAATLRADLDALEASIVDGGEVDLSGIIARLDALDVSIADHDTAISDNTSGIASINDEIAIIKQDIIDLQNAGGGGGGTIDLRGSQFIRVEDVISGDQSWTEVSLEVVGELAQDLLSEMGITNQSPSHVYMRRTNGISYAQSLSNFSRHVIREIPSREDVLSDSSEVVVTYGANVGNISIQELLNAGMSFLPGFSDTSTQTLKNVNGSIQWVDDPED